MRDGLAVGVGVGEGRVRRSLRLDLTVVCGVEVVVGVAVSAGVWVRVGAGVDVAGGRVEVGGTVVGDGNGLAVAVVANVCAVSTRATATTLNKNRHSSTRMKS